MQNHANQSEKYFVIKRGLWDSRPRNLIFNPEYLEFDEKIVGEDKPTRIYKNQIKEYRFGIVWLRGLKFYIGRQYNIYIKTYDSQVLRINFLTYYGINKEALTTKYIEIVNNVFCFYFTDLVQVVLEKFYGGESIVICDVTINKDFVMIKSNQLFRVVENKIKWENLKTRSYKTYYAIYSSINTEDINKSYKFLDDYNVSILRCVLETIIDGKKQVNSLL